MKNRTTQRVILTAAGLAVASLTLAACGGGGEASTELSDEPVTLSITWWGGDARATQTQEAIDAFEAKYTNITVEPQNSDWAGYWDQLATATAAGDSPDVVQMDEVYLASYGARGALFDLGKLDFDTSDMPEDIVGTGQVDDVQYAAPIGINVYSIVANADLFEKYGVELPDDETWTWDDYAAVSEELTEKSGGAINGTTQVGGFDVGGVRYWGRSIDSELFDGNEVTLDPKALVNMWDYHLKLIESGGMESAASIVESLAAGLSGGSLATGKVAMGPHYNSQLTAITEASGANMVLLKLPEPTGVDPNFYKPSMFWSVSATSEHPAEAALLADFLVNSEPAAEIIKTERGIPANTEMRELITPLLAPTDQAAVEFMETVTPGDPFLTPNGASGTEGIFARYSQEVLSGQSSPSDAADAALAELQSEIDAAN